MIHLLKTISNSRRRNFNPLTLSPALWLDAADETTLFDATTGGNYVAPDGAVARWEDKSGNGRHATQGTLANRPLRKTAIKNGKDVVRFDGNSDFMTVAHNADLNLQIANKTIYIIYKKSAGFRIMQKKDGQGITADAWFFDDAGSLGVAGCFTTTYPTNQNAWNMDHATWDGAAIKHWRNGNKQVPGNVTNGIISNSELVPTNTPQVNANDIYIGRRNNFAGTSGIMTGDIAELLVFPTALSDANRQLVEAYLNQKWAIY